MRWYHWILCYMVIICFFALAVIPEMEFGIWFGVICVSGIVLGIAGIKLLPYDREKL